MKSIAFDAASSGSGSGNPLNFSHTCTGTDLILIVGVYAAGGDVISGVTYNGVAMTQVTKSAGSAGGENYLYLLVNPATGSNTISISGTSNKVAVAASYTNVSASSEPDASTTNSSGASTTYSESLTSITDNCWHVSVVFGASDTNVISAGANTTIETHKESTGFGVTMAIGDNHAAIHPAASNTLNFSSSSMAWWSIGVTLKAAPDAYTLALAQGSYTYTGQAALFAHNYAPFALAQGSYALTGQAQTLTPFYLWVNATKNTSSMSNATMHSSSWVNATKNTSIMTNQTKH